MTAFLVPALLCFFLLSGCNNESTPSPAAVPTKTGLKAEVGTPAIPLQAPPFLSTPIDTTIVETTNEALPVWRRFARNRPLLVIVSQGPALSPIPEEAIKAASKLLRDGDDDTLKARTGMNDPSPIFLPPMSVSAALDANWFSGVVWVFPSSAAPNQIDPNTFRRQITAAGFASSEEAEALTFDGEVFRGSIRGRSFVAAPLPALPQLEQPALLHIDVDYFKPLYKGEIKTPLHTLLYDLLNGIKDKGLKVAAGTVSLSNLGAELPLKTRFLGQEIADVMLDPGLLTENLPVAWQERANALYLENFMQKDKQKVIYENLEKQEPADASLKFALYHLARQSQNSGDAALNYLQQAARIDPIYALEYLALADLALQKKKPEKAVEMILLARAARPNDPFLLLQAARTMLNAGVPERAKALLPELATLHWSKSYYPELAQETAGLIELLKN